MGTINAQMQRDWDIRAREDPMHYINWDHPPGFSDATSFYQNGERQAIELLRLGTEPLRFQPDGGRMLDIGCGLGRFFPGYLRVGFSEIWGIDVSEQMVEKGRELCPISTARFILGSGTDLSPLPSASIDYCFSYIVFQHLPTKSAILGYLPEVFRVLKPGGCFQLHFRRSYTLTAEIVRFLPQSLLPLAIALRRLLAFRKPSLIEVREASKLTGGKETFWGSTVSPELVANTLRQLGLAEVETMLDSSHPDGTRFWAIGRKPTDESAMPDELR